MPAAVADATPAPPVAAAGSCRPHSSTQCHLALKAATCAMLALEETDRYATPTACARAACAIDDQALRQHITAPTVCVPGPALLQ